MLENPDLQASPDARERGLAQEWRAISQVQEESLKQLREQTTALGETCAAAAGLALRGFDRAEARIAALEANLQDRLAILSQQVESTLAEMRRQLVAPQHPSQVAPFPLDGVVRIHEQLRGDERMLPAADQGAAPPPPVPALTDAAAARRTRYWLLATAAASLAAVTALGMRFERQVTAAANQVTAAEQRAQATTEDAARLIAETRAAAEQQIAGAREAARVAQIVSGVLAAPDAVRFNLVATDTGAGAYGHVLWSRSRGLVVTTSRLPALSGGRTYQAWLVTGTEHVNAGPVDPDQNGRATLAVELPAIPRPVRSVIVTAEQTAATDRPRGDIVLARPQPVAVSAPAEPEAPPAQ